MDKLYADVAEYDQMIYNPAQVTTALEDAGRDPIAPQYAVAVLDELAADDAVLSCDSGTIATWAARHWMIRGGREFFLWEQMVLGYPEHGVRYPQPFVNYAALAEANGALGIKVEKAAGVRGAVQQLAHQGPALLDVNANPDEPPLPGKVEHEQAKKFTGAFLRGQPRKATIATTLFKDKISQLKA
jgi:thiamine pyrophosphate-dependent acetolactate synthase large subunit-like protein